MKELRTELEDLGFPSIAESLNSITKEEAICDLYRCRVECTEEELPTHIYKRALTIIELYHNQ